MCVFVYNYYVDSVFTFNDRSIDGRLIGSTARSAHIYQHSLPRRKDQKALYLV